ncbi:MAG: type III secretion system gatekeeper subunit SctW [Desulfovibrio sp.]|jgi:type III secretion protein W|nr:type III secretion system gatekeeper subunit SctW [Desulfovibrio sp.]
MAVDFSIHAPYPGAQGQTGGASGTQAASGVFMGRAAAVVDNPMSLLANAAEELTFSVDTTDEFALSEREEEDKAPKAREELLRLYKELMHQAGKSGELNRLVDQLRNSVSKSEVARQTRERFPDPSDAYAALDHALEELEREGASRECLRAVKDARDDILTNEGPAVRAGIQAMLSAQGYRDLDGGDALRGLYRRAVCDFSGVNELFNHILDKYGQDKFDQAMNFLTRTLSSDLSADVPSMEKAHLENVNANLGLVRLVQSAYAQCVKVMDRWRDVHGIEDCRLDARTLLGKILALREENFLGAASFERMAAEAGPPDIEREVLFLQELMRMTRSLPSQLFDGHGGYMKVLEAVQDAVDNAIGREDAFYAAKGE